MRKGNALIHLEYVLRDKGIVSRNMYGVLIMIFSMGDQTGSFAKSS